MPDYKTHMDKYNHNKVFLSHCIHAYKSETFEDWEIVAYFYACIHLIEAILWKKYQEDPNDHADRDTMMTAHQETFDYNNIIKKYNTLKGLATTARYRGLFEVDGTDALKAQTYFEDIEAELNEFLAS